MTLDVTTMPANAGDPALPASVFGGSQADGADAALFQLVMNALSAAGGAALAPADRAALETADIDWQALPADVIQSLLDGSLDPDELPSDLVAILNAMAATHGVSGEAPAVPVTPPIPPSGVPADEADATDDEESDPFAAVDLDTLIGRGRPLAAKAAVEGDDVTTLAGRRRARAAKDETGVSDTDDTNATNVAPPDLPVDAIAPPVIDVTAAPTDNDTDADDETLALTAATAGEETNDALQWLATDLPAAEPEPEPATAPRPLRDSAPINPSEVKAARRFAPPHAFRAAKDNALDRPHADALHHLTAPLTTKTAGAAPEPGETAGQSSAMANGDATRAARELAHAVQTHLIKIARAQEPPAARAGEGADQTAPAENVELTPEQPQEPEAPVPVFTSAARRDGQLTTLTFADLAPRLKAMLLPLPLTTTTTGLAARAIPDFETSTGSGSHHGFERGPELPASVSKRLAQTVETVTGFDTMLGSTGASAPLASAPVEHEPTVPNAPAVMSSIVQSMRLQYRDGVGTAVINLDPGFLGGVAISLQVVNGAVTATLQADNPQVRAWLEANEPLLRQGLEAQGLTLDRLVVAKEQSRQDHWNMPDEQRRQQQQKQDEKPRARRTETATFEVIV